MYVRMFVCLLVFTALHYSCSVLRGGHLPLRAVWLFLLCVSLEVFATPTRRYHGRMLVHPSPPACATPFPKGAATHASSGPSRLRRRLLHACLGDPISLATCLGTVWHIVCVTAYNGSKQRVSPFHRDLFRLQR